MLSLRTMGCDTDMATELRKELRESQNQRDKRIEDLWKTLNPGKTELDLRALQRGLRKIDHRKSGLCLSTLECWAITDGLACRSAGECGCDVAQDHGGGGHQPRREDIVPGWVFSRSGLSLQVLGEGTLGR